jgi:hypothetical protein
MNSSRICKTIPPYDKAEAAIVIPTLLLAAGLQVWALAAIVNRPRIENAPTEIQSRACPREPYKLAKSATASTAPSQSS